MSDFVSRQNININNVRFCEQTKYKYNKAGTNMGHIDQPSDIGRLTSVWKLILLSTGLSYCLCIDVWRKTEAE